MDENVLLVLIVALALTACADLLERERGADLMMKLRQPQARRRKHRSPRRYLPALLVVGMLGFVLATGAPGDVRTVIASLVGRAANGSLTSPAGPRSAGTNGAVRSTAHPSDLGPPAPRVGSPAPEIRVLDVEGQRLDLAELRGRVVLLNFWASWCKPCEAEMADLQALHAEQAARGFTVVGVNEGEEPARAAQFLRSKGITFPTGLDLDMAVTYRYQVFGLPNTFLIDADGVIKDRVVGPLTLEQMRSRVVKVLDGQAVERPRFTSVWATMAPENDKPAAEVLGQTVTVGDINRRVDLENALTLLRGGLPPDLSTAEGRAYVQEQQRALLERLVDERVITARGQLVGLSIPEAEVRADVERIAGEANLDLASLTRELAALGSDVALLAEAQRAARLIGAFTLDYILTGRTPERTQDLDAWMAAARAAAKVRLLTP